jgi:predicted phosphate transport protein (TIGR00153 family)
MRVRLIPREERFFDMFVEDAANVLKGARLLEAMLRTYEQPEEQAKALIEVEHDGDEISHAIGKRLNTTFVTPFDREDIHALISALDDVLDLIEETADTFILYHIERPTPAAIEQASIIVKQCELIHEALTKLRSFRGLPHYWIEIHRLENEGDRVTRAAVAGLFSDGQQPVDIIKWKDVYGVLEDCIDKCEDVANIIEKIAIKHA